MLESMRNLFADRSSSDGAAILSEYVRTPPSDQNALDLYANEWSSQMPAGSDLVTEPGIAQLFEDGRITWAEDVLGGFNGKRVLELGPLEAGHTKMMHDLGASEIIAVEANKRAFLKSLIVKEVFGLDRAKFLLGDFVEYLREPVEPFDITIASGVLYHMEDPVELLALIGKSSDRLLLWTQYFDDSVLDGRPGFEGRFSNLETATYEGFTYEFASQAYLQTLNWVGFCGGPEENSKWLSRASLLAAIEHFGYTNHEIAFDAPDHPNGPAIAICAWR